MGENPAFQTEGFSGADHDLDSFGASLTASLLFSIVG